MINPWFFSNLLLELTKSEIVEKAQTFWQELEKRHVTRIVIPYVVVSLFIILAIDLTVKQLFWPEWIIIGAEMLLLTFFPVALILAWNYEMSPNGFIHIKSEEAKANPYLPSEKKPLTGLLFILIWVIMIVAISYYRFL